MNNFYFSDHIFNTFAAWGLIQSYCELNRLEANFIVLFYDFMFDDRPESNMWIYDFFVSCARRVTVLRAVCL